MTVIRPTLFANTVNEKCTYTHSKICASSSILSSNISCGSFDQNSARLAATTCHDLTRCGYTVPETQAIVVAVNPVVISVAVNMIDADDVIN
ncbi:unnamed protein product [Ceratitis capitata]|uniref:(Mediterranean fruit fly) hypothetical protein n=1 Tax=Ceratitis capitata TaxID=7213 RepID=A0A811UBI6_CERCA|nr:unnamed protein product [Ceratitis capitata]